MKKIQFIENPEDFSKTEMDKLHGGFCSTMCLILAGNDEIMEKSILNKQQNRNKNHNSGKGHFSLSNVLYAGKGGFCLLFMFDE